MREVGRQVLGDNDFTGLLVLRGSPGKSVCFSSRINHLPRLLVLRGPEQNSTEMAEKIGPHHAERVLGEIPRQLREGRREHQRQDDGLGLLGLQAAALNAMRDEVIGITSTPGGLGLCAPRSLTRWGRTGTLATAHAPVGHKPMAADAAGSLREHPQMLASATGNQGGPLLPSTPGSILASAEVLRLFQIEKLEIRFCQALRESWTFEELRVDIHTRFDLLEELRVALH